MRIALLSYRGNMYCGGQGVYLYYLSKALADKGHQVSVLVAPPYPAEMPWARVIRLHDENFINQPKEYIPSDKPFNMFQPLNFLEYSLSRAGSNPEMLAFSLRAFRIIKGMHEKEPFDIVHDNQGLGYGLYLVRCLGVPIMATIHHPLQVDRRQDIIQLPGFFSKARRALYYPLFMQAWTARRLDALATVSEFSKKLLARTYNIDPSRIRTIYNGIDHQTFKPLDGLKRQPGRILFVGSTEDRKKGIIYLLRAMRLLDDRSVHLVLVDGRLYPGRVYARNLISQMGLSERVSFREKISTTELVAEYNKAEVAVLPSLFEGFGIPALEAMACGTPLVATTAGAIPEVTGPDREAAILVPPADEVALARAIQGIRKDQNLQNRLSESGRKRAQNFFTWERAAEAMENVYNECIKNFRSGFKKN